MTEIMLHATPRLRNVLMAQVRAVGYALRGPALVAGPLAALALLFGTLEFMRASDAMHFHPERQEMLFGLLGVLLPVGLWMGEERIGSGFLWTLPVDCRRHAVARVFAGWVWLMGFVALFVLWMLALAIASGGSVLAAEPLHLVIDGVVQTVFWAPRPILWVVPFTAATATYLLASALALGTRHPLRWTVGTVLALFLIVGFAEDTNSAWLATAPGRALRGIFDGPYGLDAVLTARTGSLKTETTLPTGEAAVVWHALPNIGQWAMASLLWTGAGVVALLAAASRHGERR